MSPTVAAPPDPKEKLYGVADRAWQVVAGCNPNMPCAPRCWARKTVARVVECQRPVNPARAEFFQIALTPDGKRWSGEVRLDEAHLTDPMRWKKPAVIATGFHGDWGRLKSDDLDKILAVMALCPQHQFMALTKEPQDLLDYFGADIPLSSREELVMAQAAHTARVVWDGRGSIRAHYFGCGTIGDISNRRPWPGFPLRNVSIGCSVMNQAEALRMRRPMAAISALGWRTHVWYEPAIGPVDWDGWEFIERLIIGGESGTNPRPFDLAWGRNSLKWCRTQRIAAVVKQLGADPREERGASPVARENLWPLNLKSRKGDDIAEFPSDLQVRELPGVRQ